MAHLNSLTTSFASRGLVGYSQIGGAPSPAYLGNHYHVRIASTDNPITPRRHVR